MQRTGNLDSIPNLKELSYRGFTGKEKPHMVQFKNFRKLAGCQRRRLLIKFRQAIRHFKRLPAFEKRIHEFWGLNLTFMHKLSEFDNGVKYILICVDVFSRLVRVPSMNSKNASEAVVAFKKMVRKNTKPDRVWVDQGTEDDKRENSTNFARVKTSKSTLQEVKQKML